MLSGIPINLIMKKSYFKNQDGQTLVVIFMLMVIALTIGVALASRYIKTLHVLTETDNSARALAVAEAAVEHILLLPISTLEDYAQNGTCTTDCYLEITSADGQVVSATIELSKLGNSTDPFVIDLATDSTYQINLVGYPDNQDVSVCWNTVDMSVTTIFIHGTTGGYSADAYSYNPTTTSHSDNNFDIAAPSFGYANCFTINSQTDPAMLRIKAYYEEGPAVIVPSSGNALPTQGILIESTGKAGAAEKKVVVIITDPILPQIFDYALYQKSTTQPLSN